MENAYSGRSTRVVPKRRLTKDVLEIETAVCPLNAAVSGDYRPDIPVSMELTLHPERLSVFENEDAYMESSRGSMAPEAIIPCGCFCLPEKEESFRPDTTACINGVVSEVLLREGAGRRGKRYEIGLSCLGVEFTVFADPEFFPTAPQIGNILHGVFRVFGREAKNSPGFCAHSAIE